MKPFTYTQVTELGSYICAITGYKANRFMGRKKLNLTLKS